MFPNTDDHILKTYILPNIFRGTIVNDKLQGLYCYCQTDLNNVIEELQWTYVKDNKIISPLIYLKRSNFKEIKFNTEGNFQSYEHYLLLTHDGEFNYDPIPMTKDQFLNESIESLSQMLDNIYKDFKNKDNNLNISATYNPSLPNYIDFRYIDDQMTHRNDYRHREEKYLDNETPYIIDEELAAEANLWFNDNPGDYQPEHNNIVKKSFNGIILHPIFNIK